MIALFNHLAEAGDLARKIADVYLPGIPRPSHQSLEPRDDDALVDYCGFYLDEETGKGFEVLIEDGVLSLDEMGNRIALSEDGDGSFVDCRGDLRLTFPSSDEPVVDIRSFPANYRARLPRSRMASGTFDSGRFIGRFHCAELESTITLEDDGHGLLARVAGPLGEVEGWPLRAVTDDVLMMECQRSLDYRPPGEFVLWFRRDGVGRPYELTVSCSLAFGIRFPRI